VSEFVQGAALLVIGGVITGVGFLIKRRLERGDDAVDRFIARYKRVLELQPAKSEPVSSEQAERIAELLHELHPGVGFQETLYAQNENITQAEINMRAGQEADAAGLSVSQFVERLSFRLTEEQRAVLQEAQASWERYSSLQSSLAADAFAGGTIMPAIYHSERRALAQERAGALKRILDSYDL
jgi:RecG-like helicase